MTTLDQLRVLTGTDDDYQHVIDVTRKATRADLIAVSLNEGAEKVTTECCLNCAFEASRRGNREGTYIVWEVEE